MALNFVQEVWAAAMFTAFQSAEVIAPTVNRDYEELGGKIHVTGATTPTVQDYATGPQGGSARTFNIEDLADSTVELAIDQEKAVVFKVDDVDRVQAAGSFDPYITASAGALVEDSETYILDQMAAGGTSVGTEALADSGAAYDKVNQIRKALSNAKVPMTDRYLAVNPDFASYLLGSDSKLVSVEAGTENEVRNGVLGRLLGFTVIETPLLTADGGPAAIGYHRSAVAYVNQIQKVETDRAANAFGDVIKMLHVYGAKVLKPSGVQVYAAAEEEEPNGD